MNESILLRNPLTGQTVNKGNYETKTADDWTAQGYKPVLSRVENGGELFYQDEGNGKQWQNFVQRPAGYSNNSVIGVSDVPKITEGSEEINDEVINLNNDMAGLDDKTEVNQDGFDVNAEFEKWKNEYESTKLINQSELDQINEAGTAAGQEFDPLIRDAQDRAKFGQDANVVATGRKGGFQRARYAGEAALGPTQGDVGYEGSGGKLEYSASAYQRNIDDLITQKNRAISLAKASAREAIKSGKEADFARTKEILTFARQLKQDQEAAEQQKFDNEFKMGQERRIATDSNRRYELDVEKFFTGEERLQRAQDLDENKFNYQISKDMETKALESIKRMAESKIDIASLSDEEIRRMEYEAGLEEGTFEAFYDNILEKALYGETMDGLEMDQLKAQISRNKQLSSGSGTGAGTASEGFRDYKTETSFRSKAADTAIYFKSQLEEKIEGIKDPEEQNRQTQIALNNAYNEMRAQWSDGDVSDDAILGYISTTFGLAPAGSEELPGETSGESDPLQNSFGAGSFSQTPITERAKKLSEFGGGTYVMNQLLRDGYNKQDVEDAVYTGFVTETGRKMADWFYGVTGGK